MSVVYQDLKRQVAEIVPLANDAIHIYVGFACYIVTLALFRLRASSLLALIPGLIVSVLMEVSDIRADLQAGDVPRWLNSMKDVVNTNLIPFVLVLLSRLRGSSREA